MSFRSLNISEVVLRQEESTKVTISPTSQALLQYKYEDSVHTEAHFLLTVRNAQQFPVCSLVSVQPLENEVSCVRVVIPGNADPHTYSCTTSAQT